MAPIEHNDQVVAVVWVPPLTGLQRVADEIGTPLAIGAVLLLIGGTVVATLVIFRPAQARLSAVEEAARRFGEGDLSARAPEMGGDEVAAVATAFNRMAADLAARQAQLVEADRARRQLLADVSHELMTPLTAIRGYAETLGLPQFIPPSKEGQRAVKVIHEEGERIERLVKDLLDLARFEAGGISLALENVDVDEIFERVSERHAQAAQDKGVTIVIEPHEDDIRLVGDPHRLEQAVQNLASNALRHTPPGGAIRLGASRDNGKVKLTVADNGVGIPRAAPAARLRSVLQGRPVTIASGIGPRPVDREGDHRSARRHRVSSEPAGRRHRVRDRAASCQRASVAAIGRALSRRLVRRSCSDGGSLGGGGDGGAQERREHAL